MPTMTTRLAEILQFAKATRTKVFLGFFDKLIELSIHGIALNLCIEKRSIELLVPSTELGEFSWRESLNGLYDFFDSTHGDNITRRNGLRKPVRG